MSQEKSSSLDHPMPNKVVPGVFGPLRKDRFRPPKISPNVVVCTDEYLMLAELDMNKYINWSAGGGTVLVLAFGFFVLFLVSLSMVHAEGGVLAMTIEAILALFFAVLGLAMIRYGRKKMFSAPVIAYRETGMIELEGHPPYHINDLEAYYQMGPPVGAAMVAQGILYLLHYDPKTGTRSNVIPFKIAPAIQDIYDAQSLWSVVVHYLKPEEPYPNIPEFWPTILHTQGSWDGEGLPDKDAIYRLAKDWQEQMTRQGHERATKATMQQVYSGEYRASYQEETVKPPKKLRKKTRSIGRGVKFD